jgi:hypothetical protein
MATGSLPGRFEESSKSDNQEIESARKVSNTRAAAVQKHRAATAPASQGNMPGRRQKRTKARIVS